MEDNEEDKDSKGSATVMDYFNNNMELDEREWRSGLTVDLRISGYELLIT